MNNLENKKKLKEVEKNTCRAEAKNLRISSVDLDSASPIPNSTNLKSVTKFLTAAWASSRSIFTFTSF